MFIREAKQIADDLIMRMTPACDRIEIAGSIRRGCQIVKDIEIVAVPKWMETPSHDLFALSTERTNLLHEWAVKDPSGAIVQWIKPGTKEIIPWLPKSDGRYWRGLVDNQIKLDLFLTTKEHFGIIKLIRTGCAEFSQGVMTYAKHCTSYRVKDGALTDTRGHILETFEEQDVFDALHLDFVEPRERSGFEAVLRNGQLIFPSGYSIKNMARLNG